MGGGKSRISPESHLPSRVKGWSPAPILDLLSGETAEAAPCYLRRGNALRQRPRSSAQSWAGPKGPLSTASVLPPCHTLSQYSWVMSLPFMVMGKAATPKGQTSHLQTFTITPRNRLERCWCLHACAQSPDLSPGFILPGNAPRCSSVTSTPGDGSGLRKATPRAADHGKMICHHQWQNLGQHPKDLARPTH